MSVPAYPIVEGDFVMPNPENHLANGLPTSPPRANQASIPKPPPVPASKKIPLIKVLSVHDYKENQSMLDAALGSSQKEKGTDVFGGLGKQ
jgi:hypothetical protein